MGCKWRIIYLREIWKYKPDFLFLLDTKQGTTFVQGFPVNFGLDNQIMVDHFGTSEELAMYYNKEYQDIFKSKIDNSREHLHVSF